MTRVWITGGGSGIGKALALSFAESGQDVVVSGRDKAKLDAVSALSAQIEAIPCDVTNPDSVADCVASLGPIDIAVLNAGTYAPGPVSDASMEDFRQAMEVNYFGVLNCIQAILPRLKAGGGRLVGVASLAGYVGLPNASGYGPSKAALISLFESLRAELQDSPVTVQLVNPGFVKSRLTDKNDFTMPYLMEPEEAARAIRKGLETDRFEIAFPAPFVRRMKLLRLLPYRAYFKLARRMARA